MELAKDVFLKKCKRCGKDGYILSNGFCARCDDVLYGKPNRCNRALPTNPNPYKIKTTHRLMYTATG